MSVALICLHSEPFDLSRTRVCENEQDSTSLEVVKDVESSMAARNDVEEQPGDISIQTESQHAEDHKSEQETLGEIAEVRIEGDNVEVADATNHSVDGLESTFPSGPVSGEDMALQSSLMDKADDLDAACLSPGKLEPQPVEENASTVDVRRGEGVDALEYFENNTEVRGDTETDFPVSLTVASVETGGCDNMMSLNGDQPMEGIVNNSPLMNEDEVLKSDLGCDDKDLISGCMQGEGTKGDSSFSLEVDVDLKIPSSNDEEHAGCQEADTHNALNAEIAADHAMLEDRCVSFGPFSSEVLSFDVA